MNTDKKCYVRARYGYAYTGAYDKDFDVIELFYIVGPKKGKRAWDYVDMVEPVENELALKVLFEEK